MLNSYIIYGLTILLSVFFAGLAQKFQKKDKNGNSHPNRLFWILSMSVLIFVMGFRSFTVGVDGLNYIIGYEYANSVSVWHYYSTKVTEPGFYLLYRLVYFIFDDYQWLFIISAFITILFFYKALKYEINNISLPFAVFVFSTTQYFYYFGIMRMGIAVAIVSYAYRFVIEEKKIKFIILVIIATLFHYSALFSLILLFITKRKNEYNKKNFLRIIVILPLAFIFIRYAIYPFITIERYQNYIESGGLISLGFLTSIPLLILFWLFNKRYDSVPGNAKFYYYLFIIKVITEIFSPLIGIGRMVWFVNLSICFLFPALIKINKDKGMKALILVLSIIYCLFYCIYAYFGVSSRGESMFPYLFHFEE